MLFWHALPHPKIFYRCYFLFLFLFEFRIAPHPLHQSKCANHTHLTFLLRSFDSLKTRPGTPARMAVHLYHGKHRLPITKVRLETHLKPTWLCRISTRDQCAVSRGVLMSW